jgi:hypothetical protein
MTASPAVVQGSEPGYLDLTLARLIQIWWTLLWRGVLLGIGSGFVVGFVEGFVGALIRVPAHSMRRITIISGFTVGLPAGVYAVYLSLKKRYREFSIRLVANS